MKHNKISFCNKQNNEVISCSHNDEINKFKVEDTLKRNLIDTNLQFKSVEDSSEKEDVKTRRVVKEKKKLSIKKIEKLNIQNFKQSDYTCREKTIPNCNNHKSKKLVKKSERLAKKNQHRIAEKNCIYTVCVSNASTKPIEEKLKMILRRVVKKSQTNLILDHNSSSKLV